jgi:chorismate mutase
MDSTQTQAQQTLQNFRQQIDAIDNELVSLITKRSHIVAQVKQLKDANWQADCHIRAGREGAMHADMFARFKDSPIGAQAGAELWRTLISASTMVESPLRIGTLPQTTLLAQCYFSPLAHYQQADNPGTLKQMLSSHQVEIICIPYPASDSDAAFLIDLFTQHSDLAIFAYAPLVLRNNTIPEALFIGRIQAETSGDDWSYFLLSDNTATLAEGDVLCASHEATRLIRITGFHPTHPQHASAEFIGAHACPLYISND